MLRRGAFAALVIALAVSVQARADDDDEVREDVLSCEDALARLAGCCPGFDATKVECHYYRHESPGGCGFGPSYDNEDPAFTLDESRCIRDASCDILVQSHVCDRAQNAAARITHGGRGACRRLHVRRRVLDRMGRRQLRRMQRAGEQRVEHERPRRRRGRQDDGPRSARAGVSMRRRLAAAILLFAHAAHAGEDDAAPEARRGIDARLSASGDYASLVGLSFFGASAAGAIGGVVSAPVGVYGGLSYMRAETSNGLAVDDGTIDVMIEATTGRLRFGVGTGLARLVVHRVSESTTIDRWGASGFVFASCDVWQSARGQGLFVVLRPEMQIFSTTMPRAALGLGFRF